MIDWIICIVLNVICVDGDCEWDWKVCKFGEITYQI
jgi:hypothetical protein